MKEASYPLIAPILKYEHGDSSMWRGNGTPHFYSSYILTLENTIKMQCLDSNKLAAQTLFRVFIAH